MRGALHVPTEKSRKLVLELAACGADQEHIAKRLGIAERSLRKHYKQELALATQQANSAVAGKLFNKAMSGDTACMIFWLKTRAQWRETNRTELTGADGKELRAPVVNLTLTTAKPDKPDG